MGGWTGWRDFNPEDLKKKRKATGNPGKSLSEKIITQQIRQYLKIKNIYHWKVFQTLGVQKGIPDILAILPPHGKFMAIEVKTAKGKVNDYQQAFLENASKSGAIAFVARSVDDVIQLVNAYESNLKIKSDSSS